MPPPVICSGPSSGARLANPAASAGPKTSCIFSGSTDVRQPAVGQLRGHLEVLVAQRGHPDRDVRPRAGG